MLSSTYAVSFTLASLIGVVLRIQCRYSKDSMNQITTHLLLFAIAMAPPFGSLAISNAGYSEQMCQCDDNSTQTSCCCSSESVGSCCGSTETETICDCGCNDRPLPTPASTENRTSELLRIVSPFIVTMLDRPGDSERLTRPNSTNHNFYGGLSAQPFFCLWLI